MKLKFNANTYEQEDLNKAKREDLKDKKELREGELREGDPRKLIRDPEVIWTELSGKEKFNYLREQLLQEFDKLSTAATAKLDKPNQKEEFSQVINERKSAINKLTYENDGLAGLKSKVQEFLQSQQTVVNKKKSGFLGIGVVSNGKLKDGGSKLSAEDAKEVGDELMKTINIVTSIDLALVESSTGGIKLDLTIPPEIILAKKNLDGDFNNNIANDQIIGEPEYSQGIRKAKEAVDKKQLAIDQVLKNIESKNKEIYSATVKLEYAKAVNNGRKDQLQAIAGEASTRLQSEITASNAIQTIKDTEELLNGKPGDTNKPGLKQELINLKAEYATLSSNNEGELGDLQLKYEKKVDEYGQFIDTHTQRYISEYITPYENHFKSEKAAKFAELDTRIGSIETEIANLQSSSDHGLIFYRTTINTLNGEISDLLSKNETEGLEYKQKARAESEEMLMKNVLEIQDRVVQVYTNISQKYHIEDQYCDSQITMNKDLKGFHENNYRVLNDQFESLGGDINKKKDLLNLYNSSKEQLNREIEEQKKKMRQELSADPSKDVTAYTNLIAQNTSELKFYEEQTKLLNKQVGEGGTLIKKQNELKTKLATEKGTIENYKKKIEYQEDKKLLISEYIKYLQADGKQKLATYNETLAKSILDQYKSNKKKYEELAAGLDSRITELAKRITTYDYQGENGAEELGKDGATKQKLVEDLHEIRGEKIPLIQKESDRREQVEMDKIKKTKDTYSKNKETKTSGSNPVTNGGIQLTINSLKQKISSQYPQEALDLPEPKQRIPSNLDQLGLFIQQQVIEKK